MLRESSREYNVGICWYTFYIAPCIHFMCMPTTTTTTRWYARTTIPQGEFMWIMWLSRVLYKKSLRISYLYSMAHIQCFAILYYYYTLGLFSLAPERDIGCGIVVTFATCTRTPALLLSSYRRYSLALIHHMKRTYGLDKSMGWK